MKPESNVTIKMFYLLGFHVNQNLELLLFFLFFVMYISTITGNTIIITVIHQSSKLHSPMYLFLGNFAFMEMCYSTVTTPKMLIGLVSGNKQISILGCITQFYFFFVLGAIENYFLAVLAYDRYLAICNPLRYMTIMTNRFCLRLALMSWLISFIGSLVIIYLLSKLSFCGRNEIDNFFCDAAPFFSLSCTDTSILKGYFFSLVWIIVFSCLFFIILSYLQIIFIILKIPSNSGRKKVFSTCGSHFTVVIMYYGSVIAMYVRPDHGYTFVFDKCLSVFYAVVTPFLNPIIYSLKNKNIREAIKLYLSNIFNVWCWRCQKDFK
ncbi:olfactory receptor 6N1-like [Bufo gargarizans]|uniref:olfactory receptor 6N1-like n=1 Tax=Bufo gargarizans TaxID=30331 RepID=UPI001CF1E39F|nr:olfactory receptor 6N1-like [Bufo gargarizans]